MPDKVRVATLNVWGRHGDWPRRREVLRGGFEALQPDFVALQETVVAGEYDQVVDLFDHEVHVLHQSQRTSDGTGRSIVSRSTPVEVVEIDLCVTARVDPHDFVGRSTVARFDTSEGPVVVVNHKPSWRLGLEHERQLQAVRAAAFLEEHVGDEDVHVVVAGDFDARPESASLRFWTGRQALEGMSVHYQDSRSGPGLIRISSGPSPDPTAPAGGSREWQAQEARLSRRRRWPSAPRRRVCSATSRVGAGRGENSH